MLQSAGWQWAQDMLKKIIRKIFWGFLRHIVTDRKYAQIRFWLEFDRLPDLESPKTFNEKIQYIKLFERSSLRKTFASRIHSRSYIATVTDEKYLIPLIGVYDELTKKEWDTLPSHFVLKANHGCGMVKIIQKKKEHDFNDIYQTVKKWQKTDYYKIGREWVYKNLTRSLLVEKLLLNEESEIPEDYKFFCFNGTVEVIQVDFGRFTNQKRNLYDRNFNLLPARIIYENYSGYVSRPDNLDKAIKVSERLSAGVSFLRVDLYLLGEELYVGELTNYPGNGFAKIIPPSFDRALGDKLHLDPASRNKAHE